LITLNDDDRSDYGPENRVRTHVLDGSFVRAIDKLAVDEEPCVEVGFALESGSIEFIRE
jgi:hypothetical protein